jgi:hypothetical protein
MNAGLLLEENLSISSLRNLENYYAKKMLGFSFLESVSYGSLPDSKGLTALFPVFDSVQSIFLNS